MGPSGAGKSTILSALARRSPGGVVVTGDVRLNGRVVDDSIRKITGYMYQEDYFMTVLTVKEHLRYMARLKMDRRTTQLKREHRITTLLQVLSLTSVADSRIGGLASDGEKGILSGGEKKRLSFATACLTLPQLLFVDEPTSGLDSFTAARLVSVMKSIVLSTGASMIATIHQPSPETLAMFSSIILVAEGRMVFSGTTDEALHFFQDCGFKMSKMITEGEFLLECLATERYTDEKQSTSKLKRKIPVRKLAASFEASKYYSGIEDTIHLYEQENQLNSSDFNYKEPFWIVKLFWLIVRGILELFRNPNVQWIRIGQKLLIAWTAGVCYIGTIELDQKGVQDVQGVLFLLVTENVFAPMYAVMAVFPKEYPQFVREYRNGAYSPSAYFLSKMFVIGPGAILEAFLFTTLLYVLAGLRYELEPYLITTAFTFLCINVATSCGALFANAFSSIPVAMMYLLPVEYVSMVTSGIFMKLSSLPWMTSWLQYVSWFMYTYESMCVAQWRGVENITCPIEELRATCLLNGEEVLEHYDFSANHLIRNAVALLIFCALFQIVGFYCFVRKVKREL
uniref:Scarlet-like protein n=1 Tax=Lygus hesperus TaxID=30085 RepID=A0A3S9Y259_LYGHE|nr:scarlet-like protein [Lygus hesperus]